MTVKITVDKKAWKDVLKLLKIKNPICAYCGKKLKPEEIGGLWNDKGEYKLFCNDYICIVGYCLEDE